MAIDITTALYLLAAALVAVVIRLMDTPKTTLVVTAPDGTTKHIQWDAIIPVVAGALIAAPVGAWILGLDVLDPRGFAAIVTVGIAGLSAVKALLNVVKIGETAPPAPPA